MNYSLGVVARERFELSSSGPKPDMLDHYTNGLHGFHVTLVLFIVRGLMGGFFLNKRSHVGLSKLIKFV